MDTSTDQSTLKRESATRLKWQALAVAVGLSALFCVVYSGTNWLTSLRSNVPTLYFSWERWIPFVPAMVIPYMSIDVFFFCGPFLCSDREELTVLAKRIALSITLAGICFLLFPLQLAVERPVAEGWIGAIYNWFTSVDHPYNLCPSLHIALRTLLSDLYSRHTRGWLRVASHIWFSLVGFSTLLIYQHHVIDVAGGFVLATFCFYVIPRTSADSVVETSAGVNRDVGIRYLVASALFVVLAWLTWAWGVVWLWPAAATGLVGLSYFPGSRFSGARVYRKHAGRLPLSSRVVLAPALLGHWLSLAYYRRQCDAWNEVAPNVWIGRRLNRAEAQQAVDAGVTAVLDMSSEFSEAKPLLEQTYLHLPVLDLTAPTQAQLAEAADFIAAHSPAGIVYVHCKIGYSRSAAAVCAWLLASGAAHNVDQAIEQLRTVRPAIVIRPEILTALQEFDIHKTAVSVDGA